MSDTTNSSSTSDGDDEASRPARMVFLVVIMLATAGGNSLLLYAVSRHRKLRHTVHNIVILNMAAVGLGDCCLNMTLVLGSLASPEWSFGDTLCRWHSFVMNLVLVETVLLLTVLVCDRLLAVKFVQKYEFLISPCRLALVLIFTWLQALAFSVPFLLDTVSTTFRPKLHTCSVSDQTPLAFLCVASVLCFLAPIVAIIVIFVVICRLAYKQRHEVKTLQTRNHYTDVLMEEPRLAQEMWTVKMICVLFVMWFVLEFPYIITTYIQQYRYSEELSFSLEYPWGVDIAFIWMRFSYSALFPCAVFVWKRELRFSVRECVSCHKNNSVIDIEARVKEPSKAPAPREATVPSVPPKSRDREQKSEPPNILSFNVPVLFATSDGMHIETPHTERGDSQLFYTEILSTTRSGEIPVLKGRQLDVGDPDGDDLPLPVDTSDYDSSSEAGGRSIQDGFEYLQNKLMEAKPPSAWSAGIRNTPNTPSHKEKPPDQSHQKDSGELSGTQGADSGLELSGTGGSATEKGIQKMVETSKKSTKPDQKNPQVSPTCQSVSEKDRHKESVHTAQSAAKSRHRETLVVLDRRNEGETETEESPPILSPSTDVVPVWDTHEQVAQKQANSEHDQITHTVATPVVTENGNSENTAGTPTTKILTSGENMVASLDDRKQNTPQSLPKAPGRLKPLTTERKRKGRRAGQGKKKKTNSEDTSPQRQPNEILENGANEECISKQNGFGETAIQNGPPGHSEPPFRREPIPRPEMDHQKVNNEGGVQNQTPVSKKSSRSGGRGHKRTKTSDSQKSLLGSNSSLELQNMKTHNQNHTEGDGNRLVNGHV